MIFNQTEKEARKLKTLSIILALIGILGAGSNVRAEGGDTSEKASGDSKVSETTATTKEKDCSDVSVNCLNPHAACEESKKVIDTLMKVSRTYSEGDFAGFEKFLDDEVTIFDKSKKKLIVGKKDVMDYVKKRWKNAHQGPNPVISYTIEHPYAKVTGDTAVVTFKAVKVIGGTKKPGTYVSKSTDIFIKRNGEWKKLHYVSHWKKVKS